MAVDDSNPVKHQSVVVATCLLELKEGRSPPGRVCLSPVLVGVPSFGKSKWRRDVYTVIHRRRGRFAAATYLLQHRSLSVYLLLLFYSPLPLVLIALYPSYIFPLDYTCYNIVKICSLCTVDVYPVIYYIISTVVSFHSTQSLPYNKQ